MLLYCTPLILARSIFSLPRIREFTVAHCERLPHWQIGCSRSSTQSSGCAHPLSRRELFFLSSKKCQHIHSTRQTIFSIACGRDTLISINGGATSVFVSIAHAGRSPSTMSLLGWS